MRRALSYSGDNCIVQKARETAGDTAWAIYHSILFSIVEIIEKGAEKTKLTYAICRLEKGASPVHRFTQLRLC